MGRVRTRSVPPSVAAAPVARPMPRSATWRTCAACRTAPAGSAAPTAAVAEELAAPVRAVRPAMLTGSAADQRRRQQDELSFEPQEAAIVERAPRVRAP